jgi:hypothetical protein
MKNRVRKTKNTVLVPYNIVLVYPPNHSLAATQGCLLQLNKHVTWLIETTFDFNESDFVCSLKQAAQYATQILRSF